MSDADPRNRWVHRAALAAVLLLAAGMYTWALSSNGTANNYYSAAVLSGSQDWKAAFFGSLDTGNFITVDKPPLALWVQIASVRLFGYSSWSLLLPQAFAGVGAVALLYDSVRRIWDRRVALVAALVFALTPVTVAVNRFNIPDTVLVLTLVAAAWAMTVAVQTARLRWVLASMLFVGLGFNAKMLQAWIVLPALAGAYLFFAPVSWWRRVRDLALGGVVVAVVSFSWLAAVDLWPTDDRPYVGGSNDNTVLDLVVGYNGLSRVFGADGAPGGGPGGAPGGAPSAPAVPAAPAAPAAGTASVPAAPRGGGPAFGGEDGALRMFNDETGDQISWLLPAAAIASVAGIALAIRARRRSELVGWVLWGGWLLTHVVVFSFSEGIFHPYYTTVMAPALGAVLGAGLVALWDRRRELWAAGALGAAVLATLWWSSRLLDRVPSWNPWLRPVSLGLGALAIGLLAVSVAVTRPSGVARWLAPVAAGAVLVALLVAPTAYATTSISAEGGRMNPEAGPDEAPGAPNGAGVPLPTDATSAAIRPPTSGGTGPDSPASDALVAYLLDEHDGERWIVAARGAQGASPIIIATGGEPVMAMGGFGGHDPVPTAEQLADYIADGELRFVLLGGPGGGPGRGPGSAPGSAPGGVSAEVDDWVIEHCTSIEIDDAPEVTGLYDCAEATKDP